MAKRQEDIKNAYRAVTVEFADLHDRPERMANKKAVQHVTSLASSRKLFHALFVSELAKGHLVQRYLDVASRNTSLQEGYAWLRDRLEAFQPGMTRQSPSEQIPHLQAYTASAFDEDVRRVESARMLSNAER